MEKNEISVKTKSLVYSKIINRQATFIINKKEVEVHQHISENDPTGEYNIEYEIHDTSKILTDEEEEIIIDFYYDYNWDGEEQKMN